MAKYQAYPEYKDSGIEWLGEVPSTWTIAPLKNISLIVNGSTPKSGVDEYWDGNVQWITPTDLSQKKNSYIYDSLRKITEKGVSSCGTSLVPIGTVILSTRAPIGSLAISGGEVCTNQGCKSLVINNSSLSKFVYYFLSILTIPLNKLGRGSTFLELSSDDLGSVKLSVPTTGIEIINTFLDHETTKIDNLIEKQQQLIELLKEKRQAVISHAVTKGLNPDAPMKDSGVEWLGEVPAHWIVTKIKFLVDRFEQGWSPQCDARIADENEYGVLKVGCVNYGKFSSTENKALPKGLAPQKKYLVRKNDLLISRANTKELVGSCAVVEQDYDYLILCDKLYRINFNSFIDPNFICELLKTPIFREQIELSASGASHSMQNIGQDAIKEMSLALPPQGEIPCLLDYVYTETKKFDALTTFSQQQISLLQERRTALISAAVTGKIDVRNWVAPAGEAIADPAPQGETA